MALTFGLSRPDPQMTSPSPAMKAAVDGTAIVKWPAAMTQPPIQTALRRPQRESATQPPGRAMMYTRLV